jgi:hypothetical protein
MVGHGGGKQPPGADRRDPRHAALSVRACGDDRLDARKAEVAMSRVETKLEVLTIPVSDDSSWISFSDPDGNGWLLQEVTTRLPGRGLSSFDVATLTELLREAEKGHGQYEPTAPKHHWSDWYAAYIVARQRGKTPEEAVTDSARHMEGPRG